METHDPLDAQLRQLGQRMAGSSAVNGVMAAVAGVPFSPSLRAVRVRRWTARSAIALAACLLLAVGIANLTTQHPTTPTPDTVATNVAPSDSPSDSPHNNFTHRVAFIIPYDKILLAKAKWGYIDTTGREIIRAQFQEAMSFSEGRAAVKVNSRWGYTDVTGQLAVPAKYDAASVFLDGLAAVKIAGKWGFIDPSGREVIAPQFVDARGFHDGLACVNVDGKFGFINVHGKIVIEPQFTYASEFSEGMAVAQTGEKTGYVNDGGKLAIAAQFNVALPFRQGLAAVQIANGNWRFIDKTGKFAFDGEWSYATSFTEGRAMVRPEKNGPYGYIDTQGALVVPVKYWGAAPFSGGLARVEENSNETGLWGYIDLTGKAVFENKRISASFHNGLARAQISDPKWPMGRFGFVDHTGAMAVPDKFEWAEPFSEGLAPFAAGGDHEAVRKAMANNH